MRKFYLFCLVAMCAMTTKASAITVDDLVGEYVETTGGYDYWSYSDWEYSYLYNRVEITKVDESTVKMLNLYNWKIGDNYELPNELTGTVNFEDKTITFEPQMIDPWYYFVTVYWDNTNGYGNIDKAVVATFDENGVITLADWGLVYPDYSAAYVGFTETSLRKIDWSVDGTFDAGELASGEATLLAFTDGSYGIEEFFPGHYVHFTVNESNRIEVIGGTGYDDEEGGDYKFFYYIKEWPEDYSDYDDLYLGYGENSKFEGTEESGTISFTYGYYKSGTSTVEDATGTYTFTWGTPDDPNISDGIGSVNASAVSNAPVYSLSGQKVGRLGDNMAKGVYISNGKKFVVK